MLAKLKQHLREQELLPITLLYSPYWIRETWRTHRRHLVEKSHAGTRPPPWKMLAPNLTAPVFVLGAPRSGTTFLGDRLAVLPEISYHFEPVLTKAAVRCVYTGEWSDAKAAWLYRQVYAWLLRLQGEPDRTFCEKTPGNCFIVPFLLRTFPQAKFIHIIRDGRDSAVSLAARPWYQNASTGRGLRDPDGYLCGPGRRFWVEPDRVHEYENTNDRHRCIWLWRRYLEEALAGCENVPAEQLHEVRYEDLVEEPRPQAEAIAGFLRIENARSKEAFVSDVEKTARRDSVGRWQEALTQGESAQLEVEAGAMLARLGYQ